MLWWWWVQIGWEFFLTRDYQSQRSQPGLPPKNEIDVRIFPMDDGQFRE